MKEEICLVGRECMREEVIGSERGKTVGNESKAKVVGSKRKREGCLKKRENSWGVKKKKTQSIFR